MLELAARLGVYAEIDRVVTEDPERLLAVSAVLPLYRYDLPPAEGVRGDRGDRGDPGSLVGPRSIERPTTMGWHQHLGDLLPDTEVPPLDQALEDLRKLKQPSPLDQARRLKAAWALVRIDDEAHTDAVAAMLTPLIGSALDDPDASEELLTPRALELVELLRDVDQFPDYTAWAALVAAGVERTLISGEAATLATAGCEDSITFVTVEGEEELVLAAHIVSETEGFDVGTRTLDDIVAALAPNNWPNCLAGFWCGMDQITPAPELDPPCTFYLERVGDCPVEWFRPYLWFAIIPKEDINGNVEGFALEYDLCPRDQLDQLSALSASGTPPFEQDARVVVDSGVVKVIMRPKPGGPAGHNEIDIVSSKNLRFQEPHTVGGIGLVACVVGWAEHTRMMMSGCLYG